VPRIERLRIPKIGVDAPVIVLGLDQDGVMETPPDAWNVGWYDFSVQPGGGSNAVFAGQSTPGPAVFTSLHNLTHGDRVEARMSNGTTIAYSVASLQNVGPETNPQPIVGPAQNDQLTLIACLFTEPDRHLTGWLVVKADKR
jgi:LPXTG-site transpeptidase (sortase) family protein